MKGVFGRGLNIAAQISPSRENIAKFTRISQLDGFNVEGIGCGYLQSFYFLDDGQILKAGYYLDALTSIRVLNFYRLLPRTFRLFQKLKIFGKLLSFHGGDDHLTLLNRTELLSEGAPNKAVFNHSGLCSLKDGSMSVIGENYFGQLATGDSLTSESLRKVSPLHGYSKKVKQVSFGFQHTLLISQDGQLFGCGKSESYQIQPYKYFFDKLATINQNIEKPELIWNRSKVKLAKGGFKHTIILTENNEIYSLGSNKYGQCGKNYLQYEQIQKITKIPFLLSQNQQILDIHCGTNHTLILTTENAYFMGSIQNKQNPFSKFSQNICSPTIIPLPAKPIKIFANFDRNAIIMEDGRACIFGGRDFGYCGGENGELQYLDQWEFGLDSSIGLGFSHTIIAP